MSTNREIKFRAWDESTKTMHTCEGMNNNHSDKWNSAHIIKHFDCVMQYTGLKDKNGKEIYEGDIVTCNNADNKLPHKGHVVFLQSSCAFAINVGPQSPNSDNDYFAYLYGKIDMTVIGNIHQPELLKS